MKNKHPIQVIYLRHQVDHITPKKIQLSEEFKTDPDNVQARLFVILFRHRQIEMISDGNKIIEVKVIQMKMLNFEGLSNKVNFKKNIMNEGDLQRVYSFNIYPEDCNLSSDKGFVNRDDRSQG